MIILIIAEEQNVITGILSALRISNDSHEIHTASCFDTARKEVEKKGALDALITMAFASDGKNAFDLRDELRQQFPNLKVAFLNKHDLAGWTKRLGKDPVFRPPPEKSALINWVENIGHTSVPTGKKSLPQNLPHNALPLQILATNDENDDDIPIAETVTAPGKHLGDYELVRFIGDDEKTETHEALQLSIDRPVALVLLKPEFAQQEQAIREFRGLVRARAKVSHPNIAPVYEGYEEAGALFYTRELIEGRNLPQLYENGEKFDDRTLISMVKTIAAAQAYLETNGIDHYPIKMRHIFLGDDGKIRIANTATAESGDKETVAGLVFYLGTKLQSFVDTSNSVIGNRLLAEMCNPSVPWTWQALQGVVARCDDEIAQAAPYELKKSTAGQQTRFLRFAGILALILLAVGILLITLREPNSSKQRVLNQMIKIKGGEFHYQKQEIHTLPNFWIDTYEVSIAHYQEFISDLETTGSSEYDHPEQPPDKANHKPDNWHAYYDAASQSIRYEGHLVDLNCPVVFVDWWDAYAYAKWKGRRLPTEQEWEKSGRGKKGNLYPWGNAPDLEMFKSSQQDFSTWRPVDSVPGDKSPEGVFCLAGNVSEWTSGFIDHPEIFGAEVPVVRGGSFRNDISGMPALTVRQRVNDPGESQNGGFQGRAWIGFRTVSDINPALKISE
ncbi:MAG: SUMF1/EgtB/PvdO family nonheme iron enzyme [Verrucomicrobiales bacterium]